MFQYFQNWCNTFSAYMYICMYVCGYVCMYVCMYVAAGESWRDDEYPVSIADHLSGALHYIRRDHAQAAAGRLGLQ